MSLHRDIMNLPAVVGITVGEALGRAYKEGHRDARHAAAELASPVDALVEQLVEALRDLHRVADEWQVGYTARLRAKAALARHAELYPNTPPRQAAQE